jgi:hypothetical protein
LNRLALAAALLVASPALAQELLPPPPPPPPTDDQPRGYVPPPATPPSGQGPATTGPARDDRYGAPARDDRYGAPDKRTPAEIAARKPKWVKGTIGEGPVAAAGAQTANLHPDEDLGHWRFALASGVIGRWGGDQVKPPAANSTAMLYFGGQADGLWTEGYGRGARFRLRLLTGGENTIFIPSDGDAEAAFMLGRREFRFVAGRVEVARHSALGIESLVQAATFPSVEGSVSLRDDRMRLSYFVAPVEAAWAYYRNDNHIREAAVTPPEQKTVYPATAARLRFTGVAPPSVLLSLQVDFTKLWGVPDLVAGVEGSMGVAVLDNTVLFDLALRWDHSTLRAPDRNASRSYDQMLAMLVASLLL